MGTRFVFELTAGGLPEPVLVDGEVLAVSPVPDSSKYLLNIRYDLDPNRGGLDAVVRRVFDAQKYEKLRKHPRLPLRLGATEGTPHSPQYLVRDLSRGGVGVEIEAAQLGPAARKGELFLLELQLGIGALYLHGEIRWLTTPSPERRKWVNPAFGVEFGKLRPDTVARLQHILELKGLPPPPWRAQVSFGIDAVGRMPG